MRGSRSYGDVGLDRLVGIGGLLLSANMAWDLRAGKLLGQGSCQSSSCWPPGRPER